MQPTRPTALPFVLTVLLMVMGFLVGYQVRPGRSLPIARPVWATLASSEPLGATIDTSVSLKPVQLFQEALSAVQLDFLRPVTEKEREQFAYAGVRGMLSVLNDPYTRFMDPTEYAEFRDDNEGRFAGIGATLDSVEVPALEVTAGATGPVVCPVCGTDIARPGHYRVAITNTLEGSPARAAGLLPQDTILAVDGRSTDGMLVSDVAGLIRGEAGTDVTITIARKGEGARKDIKVRRARIEVPAVESKMLPDGIGYLRLFQFNDKTVGETEKALRAMERADVGGLVLDLRNNPGGLLDECVKVAGMLIPRERTLVVSSVGRDGRREEYPQYPPPPGAYRFTRPMVVLVNGGSASASEILSGVLQDYGRAKVIGQKTFGKGLVQTVVRLGDRSMPCAMALTTSKYFTPKGQDVAGHGITPEIAAALEPSDLVLSEKDGQAKTAIRELRKVIAGGMAP